MAHSIIVDDMDPSISYEGSWIDTTTFIQSLPSGQFPDFQQNLFNGTLRGVLNTNTTASLSYNYYGSAFVLSGGILGDSDALSIDCTVDGRPANRSRVSDGQTFFCKQDNLHDGQHTINLSISPTTANQQSGAWLDYIRYHPVNEAKAADNFQIISTKPESIMDVQGPQNNQVNFTFSGNFVTCLACLSDSSDDGSSGYAMTLTIDGNSLPSFLIDKPIFCEQSLPDGEHQVQIDYKGPNDPSGFCKPGVVVGSNGHSDACTYSPPSGAPDGCGNSTSGIPVGSPSGTISPPIPSVTAQGPPSSPDSTTSSSGVSDQDLPTSVAGHGAPIGAIVGGVIGGLALLVLLSALILVLLRRRRHLKNRALAGGSGDLILPDDRTIQTAAGNHDVVAQRRPRSSMHKSIPPPAMPQRSSIAKTRISWSQLNVDTGPQQTAQIGSDYGGSPTGSPRRESGFSLETKVEYHSEK